MEGKSETEVDALGDKRFVWLVLFSQQILYIANTDSGLDSFTRSRLFNDASESFTYYIPLLCTLFASKNVDPYPRRQHILLGILINNDISNK